MIRAVWWLSQIRDLTEQVVSLGVAFQCITLTPAFPGSESLIRRIQ